MRVITTFFVGLFLFLPLSLPFDLAATKTANAAFTFSAGKVNMYVGSYAECLAKAIGFGTKTDQTMTDEKIDRSAQTYFAQFEPKAGSDAKPASIKCEGGSLIMQNVKFQF